MVITPAHMHISKQLVSTAGIPPTRTVGTPGTQGATVAGTQGIGVNTPRAAAVAVATVGLAKLEHRPKGWMFAMGIWSIIFAAGGPPAMTRFAGSTCSAAGARPKLHVRTVPLITCREIGFSPSNSRYNNLSSQLRHRVKSKRCCLRKRQQRKARAERS